MYSSAKLNGKLRVKCYHAHFFSVFLAKKHHSAFLLCYFNGDIPVFMQRNIFSYFFIYNMLNSRNFGISHFCKMRKIKAQGFVINKGAFLCYMGSQYFSKSGMKEVGGRMVCCSIYSFFYVHFC